MQDLAKKPRYKKYGWQTNMGYGTREHQDAIKRYGINHYHRKAFVITFMNREANLSKVGSVNKT